MMTGSFCVATSSVDLRFRARPTVFGQNDEGGRQGGGDDLRTEIVIGGAELFGGCGGDHVLELAIGGRKSPTASDAPVQTIAPGTRPLHSEYQQRVGRRH